MLLRNRRVLFSTDDNGGGGTDKSGADDLGAQEAIRLRKQLGDLKADHDRLATELGSLKKTHEKLETTHKTAVEELGGYKASGARKETLSRLLGSADYKGKLDVDTDRAMKYLERGGFDEKNLESDVREAIEFVGVKARADESSLSDRGAGNELNDRPKTSDDPIADAARRGY